MTRRGLELPREVGEVGSQIERWRRERPKRSPMPAKLWDAAAGLARRHGVYRISQALQLSYESLRNRVLSLGRDDGGHSAGRSGFVELERMGFVQTTEQIGMEVEVSNKAGEKMMIRVKGSKEVELVSMLEAFWSKGR